MSNESGPHTHAEPRETEVEAFAKVAPRMRAMKYAIMQKAALAGDYGIIPDEVDGLINTVRRRITDLWKEGRLRPTERTRPNKRGNSEMVWVAGRDELQAMRPPRQSNAQRIKRLEDALREALDLLEADGSRHNVWRAALDNKPWPPEAA